MVTHLAITPVRPGLTWNSVVKGNALTASAIHVRMEMIRVGYIKSNIVILHSVTSKDKRYDIRIFCECVNFLRLDRKFSKAFGENRAHDPANLVRRSAN